MEQTQINDWDFFSKKQEKKENLDRQFDSMSEFGVTDQTHKYTDSFKKKNPKKNKLISDKNSNGTAVSSLCTF